MEKPQNHPKVIFMVCPIGGRDSGERKRSNQVKKHIVEKAFPDYDVRRSDTMTEGGSISHQIVTAIGEADLVVVDMTGHNPNVFYEMAIAHGFRRAVVHMIQEGERIPFDVTDMRTLQYDLTDPDRVEEAWQEMRKLGEAAMLSPGSTPTPLSQASAFKQVSDSEDPQGMVLEALIEEVRSLRGDVRDLRRAGGTQRVMAPKAVARARDRLLRLIRHADGIPAPMLAEAVHLMEALELSNPEIDVEFLYGESLRLSREYDLWLRDHRSGGAAAENSPEGTASRTRASRIDGRDH